MMNQAMNVKIDGIQASTPRVGTCPFVLRCVVALFVAWVLPFAASAYAQSSAIQVVTKPGIAIKGSDLIIRLTARSTSASWPRTIRVTVGDRRLSASVVWLNTDWSTQSTWTSPSEPVVAESRSVRAGERLPGIPVLLVPIPWDAQGQIRLLGEEWEPEWLSLPEKLVGPPLHRIEPDASPSQTDPFEYFRWVLMAEDAGCEPPPFQGNGMSRRLAEAITNEWRVALERTSRTSNGIASEIRERLLATAVDDNRPEGEQKIAAWLTNGQGLAVLRGIMLDTTRDEFERAHSALAWIESRPPFLAWYEMVAGDRVRIVLVNQTPAEILVEAEWQASEGSMGLLCPPLSVSRHSLERPKAISSENSLTNEVLLLSIGSQHELRLDAGSGAVPVRPPGAIIGPMLLPLTLAAVSEGFRDSAPISESTTAVLRRRFDRWEIFVDCRRNQEDASDRILLQVGNMLAPIALLEVTSKGVWRVRRGKDDPELGVAVVPHGDRWRCRITLPESWLIEAIAPDSGGSVLLGLRRDGPGHIRQYAGLPPPAWRSDIGEIAFDLGVWGDVSTDEDP